MSRKKNSLQAALKKEVVSKILLLFGNLYFSNGSQALKPSEIRSTGLFPRFASKRDGDSLAGIYQECNFLINESKLTHTESTGSGKNRSRKTVVDFKGLIVKIQMKKNFSGITIVGLDGYIKKMRGFEPVELESVKFMQGRKVYSTDQIEARYLLTTSFMERLDELGKTFMQSSGQAYYGAPDGKESSTEAVDSSIDKFETEHNLVTNFLSKQFSSMLRRATGVSAAFVDGYVYLFIPSYFDFFEVDLDKTLFDFNQYYRIYNEIASILEIIDFLKLDQKLGL